MSSDIQTEAIVLKRVNYGEADRILTLITPTGKVAAMAKGVRKARSKLAGGVEVFCLSMLNLHEGKGDLYTVTGAKMLKYYGKILKDFERMELMGKVLKEVNIKAEGEGAEFFEVTRQCLEELDGGVEVGLVEAWFLLNMLSLTEGINLYRDGSGKKLAAEKRYEWDAAEKAFRERVDGRYGVDEIKMLRLMVLERLAVVKKVRAGRGVLLNVMEFTRMVV